MKSATMAAFGLWVLGATAHNALAGTVPNAPVMGIVSVFALAANFGVVLMLYRFRDDDSNMRSVWICNRNDAVGNVAVMLAALGVFGSGAGWPDFAVGAIMATLALSGAWQIGRQAHAELKQLANATRASTNSSRPVASIAPSR